MQITKMLIYEFSLINLISYIRYCLYNIIIYIKYVIFSNNKLYTSMYNNIQKYKIFNIIHILLIYYIQL